MAFKASPSSQHQHCTDEAQRVETVLSAVIYIYIYIYIYSSNEPTEAAITTDQRKGALHDSGI